MAQFNSRIKLKRDTSSNWTNNNPVLLNGELIIVDTNSGETRIKIGDGSSTYSQLPFQDEYIRSLIGKSAKIANYVIGSSSAGWTSSQCDYLCDGSSDDIEINEAIQNLPNYGGSILILPGTYNLSNSINISKNNCVIYGSGTCTHIQSNSSNAMNITGQMCNIGNLYISGSQNYGIYISSSNNVISNIYTSGFQTGIYIYQGSFNNITYCSVSNFTYCGVSVYSNNNTVCGCTVYCGTGQESDYSGINTFMIFGDMNLISSNNCPGKQPQDSGTNNSFIGNKFGENILFPG